MDNKPIAVGDFLYREKYHKGMPPTIVRYTVNKVGSKYLYLENMDRYPINKVNLKYKSKEFSQDNFQLYRSEEEIIILRKRNELEEKLYTVFRGYCWANHLTTEQLFEINKILYP